MHTYTHRVEEEDDRMLAIKAGKSGDDKLKKYDPFASSIVSAGGSVDISKLVDPHTPSGMALSQTRHPLTLLPLVLHHHTINMNLKIHPHLWNR